MKKKAERYETHTVAGMPTGVSPVPGAGAGAGAAKPVEADAASVAPGAQDEQPGTRHRVARSILDHGPSTAADLALRLELTQAAVRRHLDSLVGEGVVEPRAQRVYGARGRGRPAKVFALTDCGRDDFDQDYDQLAADALRWIAQSAGGGETGEAAVAAFARARVAAQAERYQHALSDVPPEERTAALAGALTEDGYAATARGAPASSGGEQLCQHHCPVAHTAEKFPQLCEAETEFFSRLLGTHVQRLATIAHGDGVCTTFIPHSPADGSAQATGSAQSTDFSEPTGPGRPAGTDGTTGKTSNGTTTSAHTASSNAASAHIAGRNPA